MNDRIHQSYLLRLWRDHAAVPWRATVMSVARPSEQRHFASVDALLAFLIEQTDSVTLPAQAQAHPPAEWDCEHCTSDGAEWKDAGTPHPPAVPAAGQEAT